MNPVRPLSQKTDAFRHFVESGFETREIRSQAEKPEKRMLKIQNQQFRSMAQEIVKFPK